MTDRRSSREPGLVKHQDARRRIASSLVMANIGGRLYPARYVAQCIVCNHPARMLIEEKLLENYTYTAIAEFASTMEGIVLPEDPIGKPCPPVNPQNVSQHFNRGHCPIDTKVLHEINERHQPNLDYSDDTIARVVNHVAIVEHIAATGHARIIKGEIAPDVKDTLLAAKLMADMQTHAEQGKVADYVATFQEAMNVYFEETRRIMSSEQFRMLTSALKSNVVLKEIAERFEEANRDVVDAELVEGTA